jgi:WD40-like Beta Propeller Repeat
VKVVDLSGNVRELSAGYWGMEGMAWAPDGMSVYFSAGKSGDLFSVYRTDLGGDARLVSDNAGAMTIHDIAPDGTWALTRDDTPTRMLFRAAGSRVDVDLSWLYGSLGPVLSSDGKTLVFTDQSLLAGPNYGVAMRPTAGGPIVRLGEGSAEDISMDGKSVLAIVPSTPPRIVVYPLGAGQPVRLDRGEFENLSDAFWLPGGARVLVSGNTKGQPAGCFVLDTAGGDLTPVGPEGIWEGFPAPDVYGHGKAMKC